MLMTCGAKVYRPTVKLKVVNAFFMVLLYGILLYIYIFADGFFDEPTLIGHLGIWCRITMPLVTHIIFAIKRKRIADLMLKISKRIEDFDERKIRLFSARLLLLYVFSFTCFLSMYIYMAVYEPSTMAQNVRFYFTIESENCRWYHIVISNVVDVILLGFIIPHWPVVSAAIYVTILFSISKIEDNLMINNLNTIQSLGGVNNCITQQLDLKVLKSDFNQIFNIFPLLWYAGLFLQSSGLIVYLVTEEYGIYSLWRIACFVLLLIVTTGRMVIVISDQEKTKSRQKCILDNFSVENMDIQMFASQSKLIRILSETTKHNAILFKLDERLILAFASALVTFTVMFTQISTDLRRRMLPSFEDPR
ncbi:hypothetical protein HDE_11323 [Halotydeus destructor]|nr:hypothetical protein HDE_11323 [Halotydeus destructor]